MRHAVRNQIKSGNGYLTLENDIQVLVEHRWWIHANNEWAVKKSWNNSTQDENNKLLLQLINAIKGLTTPSFLGCIICIHAYTLNESTENVQSEELDRDCLLSTQNFERDANSHFF